MSGSRHYRGLLAGPRFSRHKHQTVVDHAVPFLKWLGEDDRVQRIVIGAVRTPGGHVWRYKVSRVPVGLYLQITDSMGRQDFFVHTEHAQAIEQEMKVRHG